MSRNYTETVYTGINDEQFPDAVNDQADLIGQSALHMLSSPGLLLFDNAKAVADDTKDDWRSRVGYYKVTVNVEYIGGYDEVAGDGGQDA